MTKQDTNYLMRKNLSEFIYKAWCVDGSVDLGQFTNVITKEGQKLSSLTFTINDKARGIFYVTLSL